VRNRILVVEDESDLLELLSFNLKKAGFSVATAKSGIEALKKARSVSPHLILLDLMLPELDGFAVCETIRKDPHNASTPIIILTALSSELARLAGFEAGASDYLSKPFRLEELLARVRGLLRGTPVTQS